VGSMWSSRVDAAASLDRFSERGWVVPERNLLSLPDLFVRRYRLLYQATPRSGISSRTRDLSAGASTRDSLHANFGMQPTALRAAADTERSATW